MTSFSQADGFIEIDALAASLDAGSEAQVTLIGGAARAPDLVIMGSHDVALDVVVGALVGARLFGARAGGRQPGRRRGGEPRPMRHRAGASDRPGERPSIMCISPPAGLTLVPGWRRMQGILFRPGDKRFEGRSAEDAIKAALADDKALMVNRNAGAGTRVLIDKLLGGARPPGYANQPKSHNAVAAAHRAGPRRLGRRHRAGGETLRPRLPAGGAGTLRFPAGRERGASVRPCRPSSPRCATKRRASASALSA